MIFRKTVACLRLQDTAATLAQTSDSAVGCVLASGRPFVWKFTDQAPLMLAKVGQAPFSFATFVVGIMLLQLLLDDRSSRDDDLRGRVCPLHGAQN